MKELKRYIKYMGKYKTSFFVIFLLTNVFQVFNNLLFPYMSKMVFNSIEYKNFDMFKVAVVICIISVILECIFPYMRYFQIRIVRKIVFDIKINIFHKLTSMNMEYYEKHHSGETLKTLNWDVNWLKTSYFNHTFWVVGRIVNGTASIIAMFAYSSILMLVSMGFSLITVFLSVLVNKKISKMEKKIQKNIANLAERLSDILSGFSLLKMYSGADIVVDSYQNENNMVSYGQEKVVRQSAVLEMLSFILGILGSFGTIIVGAILVAQGRMDYGTIMAVVSLQMAVSAMMQSFGSALTSFTGSLVRAGRVFDFFETEGEEIDDENDSKGDDLSGKGTSGSKGRVPYESPVVIKNLSFGYDDDNVLSNFNMEVKDSEKVMLAGESGCGKSTLLKLMLRFYEKKSGQILLYGKDITEYTFEELRNMITYIPQENYLFEGTIKENIAFGNNVRKELTDEDIKKAAHMAYADEFIDHLPNGYDTIITAGGNNFSGGQKQRIAIARAFLKEAPIILMDEPSSALDVVSEQKINMAIAQLMKSRIVIMVTHRMTAKEQFDRIIYVDQQKVIQGESV